MLIAIDASRANRQKKTGVEWYAYYLIKELAQIDRINDYLLYIEKTKKVTKENNYGFDFDLPVNFKIKVLNWPLKFFWTLARLSWEILRHPPEILFVPSHVLPLILPKKSVVTIHDLGFLNFPQAYSFFSRIYHFFAVSFAKKQASKIIVPSKFTKKELIDFFKIDPEKIKVIYHGFSQDKFKTILDFSEIENFLKRFNLEPGKYFLYIGRIEIKKNILNLLEAFKELLLKGKKPLCLDEYRDYCNSWRLVLVGKPGYGYKKIIKAIKELGLEKQVIELGYLKEEDLNYLMNGALALVFSSFYEGFGLPVLQAMACSLPVIVSETSSLPEIAGEAGFLVNPNSPKEITRAMEQVALNEDLAKEMIKRGLERTKEFSWQKCGQETLKVLLD